jgi:hypothetical protein
MFRLLQTVVLAGVAVRVGSSALTPTASCTVVQVDATHYDATVTWSKLSVAEVDFLQGSTLLSQTQFGRPTRSGTFTLTLSSAPTVAQLTGKTGGLRTVCSMGA